MTRVQLINQVFTIQSEDEFNEVSLHLFNYQYNNLPVYRDFVQALKIAPSSIKKIEEIPFIPIEFFKSHSILTKGLQSEIEFTSSSTTGLATSKHQVHDLRIYEKTFINAFQLFYGHPSEWCFLALLPSYLERSGSSLIYMTEKLIQMSKHRDSGFFISDHQEVRRRLKSLEEQGQKTLLFGVTFALLDLIETFSLPLYHTTVMETGGMKGRREERTRDEVHSLLKSAFHIEAIHSEYGMTELLSQAYSKGNGLFHCPPWMKILIREVSDPFSYCVVQQTGGINVIDLANIDSCAFIATQDLGKKHENQGFEVLGRFDHSDTRGCNLLAL